jgi:hypothetical protein
MEKPIWKSVKSEGLFVYIKYETTKETLKEAKYLIFLILRLPEEGIFI